MAETAARSVARIGARSTGSHHHLFLRVRNLLRINQAKQASHQFIADLDRHLTRPQSGTTSKQQQVDWLWRTAVLFRSYNHPHLALCVFKHLESRLPVPIEAVVSALQASSDLVWSDPLDARLSVEQRLDPLAGFDEFHHYQLAHSLLALTNHHYLPAQRTSSNIARSKTLEKNVETAKPTIEPSTQNTRALEVILANILKLGDMDWIVSIFRDFYPRYTHQLGLYLYPQSISSCSETIPIDESLAPDEVPSGRLVKFLVTGYMVCKDTRRAYLVVRFHRTVMDQRDSSQDWGRDMTPEVTFLRCISRTTMGSLEKRLGMVARVLKSMDRGLVELDSYGLDGLLEMRYRMRAGWGFRRRQEATLTVMTAAVDRLLALFLLHRARPSSFPLHSHSTLIHGPAQGQHAVSSWQYRPSPNAFGLLLRALRDLLRFQTRSISRPHSDPKEIERRPKKRRPSPGTHRAILAQILAFDYLNRTICRPVISIHDPPDLHLEKSPKQFVERLPTRFEILTPKIVQLLVECLLIARDYVAAWVLLNRATISEEGQDEALKLVRATRIKLSLAYPDLSFLPLLDTPPKSLLSELQTCFTLDFSAHKSLQWDLEQQKVLERIALETRKLNSPFLLSTALSEFTLDFLRKEMGKAQLDLLSYGISNYDFEGSAVT